MSVFALLPPCCQPYGASSSRNAKARDSLPAATTSTLGGVKVDGTTITIASGIISSSGSGGMVYCLGIARIARKSNFPRLLQAAKEDFSAQSKKLKVLRLSKADNHFKETPRRG